MKQCFALLIVTLLFISLTHAQEISTQYEPSATSPFGMVNPDAPQQVKDFEPMIGICDCESLSRNPDGTWQDTSKMVWKFKYIMNGTAVQDEVWRPDNNYAGSIRQYQVDSMNWVVSYFSYPFVSNTPGVWRGNTVDDQIVLWQPQKAPNGMEGDSRLTFYDFTDEGYQWKGEWVSADRSIVYPFWKIKCRKRSYYIKHIF